MNAHQLASVPRVLARRAEALVRSAARSISSLSLQLWLLLIFVAIYVEIMVFFEYVRYLALITNAWDLGIFEQALYSTTNGGPLVYYTAELPWNSTGSFFGVHFAPIVLLVAPLYWALPGALTLFVVQTAAVAGSSFPLYGLARRNIGPTGAMLLAMAYLASPPLVGAQLFDFHVESLLPVCALTLWWSWTSHRYRLAVVAAVLLSCCGEYGPIALGMIAFTFVAARAWDLGWGRIRDLRSWWTELRRPLAVCCGAVVAALIVFSIPKYFSPDTPPAFQLALPGGSASEYLWTIVTNPGAVGGALHVLSESKIRFFLGLLFCGLVLWVLAPLEVLPALPWFFVVAVSSAPGYSGLLGYQYLFLTIPFVFLATSRGARRLRSWLARAVLWWERKRHRSLEEGASGSPEQSASRQVAARRRFSAYLARRKISPIGLSMVIGLGAIAVVSQVHYAPFLQSDQWPFGGQFPDSHDAVMDELIGMIPHGASVSIQANLFPQVANRLDAYPYYHQGTDYVLVDITNFWFTTALPRPDPAWVWQQELSQNVSVPYGLLASASGGLLFELGYAGSPVFFEPYDPQVHPADLKPTQASVRGDPSAPFGSYLQPDPAAASGDVWSYPGQMLPPGAYLETLWMKTNGTAQGAMQVSTWLGENGTDLVKQVFSPSSLAPGWDPIVLSLRVPYAAVVGLEGSVVGAPSGILFGGATFQQLPNPVSLG